MKLSEISQIILARDSTSVQLQYALDQFALLCSEISNIQPDPSYTAWSDDTFLAQGVAINPQAAAFCINDYRRSVVFLRGVFAALQTLEKRAVAGESIRVLYAGCGPFATLLLPLLSRFDPSKLEICLVDIHQESLDSVAGLLKALSLDNYNITLVQADACEYQHSTRLDLIVVETMQKALEQEPQFSATATLAAQLDVNGIFVPEEITIELCLVKLQEEFEHYKKYGSLDKQKLLNEAERHPICELICLSSSEVKALSEQVEFCAELARSALPLQDVMIPAIAGLSLYQPVLFTRITVFSEHTLDDYESSLTLPSRCFDLEPLREGALYRATYVLGNYPKIHWQEITKR